MLALFAIIGLIVAFVAPIIISNINNLISQTPALQKKPEQIIKFALAQMDKLPEDVTSRITNMVKSMGDGVTNILSNSLQYITSLISTIFLLIMVPFFLIYMLKTMKNLSQQLLNFSKVNVKYFS